MTKLTSLFCIIGSFAVFSLGSYPNPSSEGESVWSQATRDFYSDLEKVDTLKSAKPPVIRPPVFEVKLGKPKVRMSPSGNYELNYANPA